MSSADFTYDHVGASRDPDYCPPGFHHLRERTRLGEGEKVFRQAADALFSWEMHREMGVGVDASAERAASDVDVTVTLAGVVRAPCRVVWAEEEYRRARLGVRDAGGASGERGGGVRRPPDGDGTVWLTVSAFSRPYPAGTPGRAARPPGLSSTLTLAAAAGFCGGLRPGG